MFDKNGNRTKLTYPDNVYFRYHHNNADKLVSIRENSDEDKAEIIAYAYDGKGRLDYLDRANGSMSILSYHPSGMVNTLLHNFSGKQHDVLFEYRYNYAGQINKLSHSNALYHERATTVGVKGSYTSNGLNQYTEVNGKALSYDNNANMTADGVNSFTFDEENRLKAIGGSNVVFKYDPVGRLHSLTKGGQTTQFVYDGDALIAEYQGNTLVKRYVHGGAIDDPLVEYNGAALSNKFYLHSNHQGSIIAASGKDGEVVYVNRYDSYGVADSTNKGRFGYTGQQVIDGYGLYYYKARIYHPKLGRFLQTDPVGYEDQMNLYAYVGNDPVNNIDPTGKWIMQAIGGVIGGIQAAQAVAGSSAHWTDKTIAVAGGVVIGAITGGRGSAAVGALAKKMTSKVAQKVIGVTAGGVVGGISGAISQLVADVVTGQNVTGEKMMQSTVNGVISGAVGGAPAKIGEAIASTIVTEAVLQASQALAQEPANATTQKNNCSDYNLQVRTKGC